MDFPDLLHATAIPQTRARSLSESLTFGFARGVDSERLLSLACPTLSGSTFDKGAFANDLFIAELTKGCFPLVIAERQHQANEPFFQCLLLSPPIDPADTQFRQEICSELIEDSNRRRSIEEAYLSVRAFRDALCGSDHFAGRTMGVRRRLDILASFRTATQALLRATGTAQSGLHRIADWAESLASQQNYERLTHLLDFENGRAVLHTTIQAGYDGSLRRFEIVKVDHAEHDAFPRGPISRFFRRLISLIKGYRFSEEDVMSSLLDRIFSDLESEVVCLIRISLQLEFYLRGLGLFDLARRRGLEVCLPSFTTPDGERQGESQPRLAGRLEGLFNPWLAADDAVDVVSCDISLDSDQRTTILTGPNSGGKTRLLQSLAVAQLLAQVGLFVPARAARLAWMDHLFLSLLEHVEARQSEGRLGSELMRIRQVFESTGPRSLVLMDELCSGTNPSEGERIFEMVLELLENLGPQVWISTHFLDFAARLKKEDRYRLRFLQVELDESSLPTFQFEDGVAETSLARNTAARLGVTREELMDLIRRHQRPEDRNDPRDPTGQS